MEVVICIGSSCHLRGSRDIIKIFERLIDANNLNDQVKLKGSFCMGKCTDGVCVSVDGKQHSICTSDAQSFFMREIMGGLKNERDRA